MLNRSASLAMSTSVLKALGGKLDIKRHSPSILYIPCHVEDLIVMQSDSIARETFSLDVEKALKHLWVCKGGFFLSVDT